MAHFTSAFLLLHDVFIVGVVTRIQPLSNNVELRPLSLEGNEIYSYYYASLTLIFFLISSTLYFQNLSITFL